MQIQSLSCSHCGAPLDVPAGTSYLTCAHCGSRLKVNRTASALFTEVMEEISGHTEAMVSHLEMIRLQNELERIDREWQIEREKHLTHDNNGARSVPSSGSGIASVIGGIVAAAFGIFWIGAASSMSAPPFMVLGGVVFVIAALASGVSGAVKASDYQKAEEDYQKRRAEILRQLNTES